jgi:RHS repeat-associated protein
MSGTACETITSLPFGDGQTISDSCGDSAGDVSPLHFTGKERDFESGLDNLEKRYYGNSLGRMMSPDPVFFQAEMLTDPQRFNEYAYRNNPLLYVNPSGEAIQLSDDPAQQQMQLNAICSAAGVGSDRCSYYLYANPVTDSNGNTTYYVGIHTNGADGQGTSFQTLNSTAGAIGSVINDQRVVQLDVAAAGTQLTDNQGGHRTIGPLDPRTNATPSATYIGKDGRWHIALLDPGTAPGTLPGSMMYGGEPGQLDQGMLLAHEIGHIRGEWGLQSGLRRLIEFKLGLDAHGNGEADKLENQVRRTRDPNAPIRIKHDPY